MKLDPDYIRARLQQALQQALQQTPHQASRSSVPTALQAAVLVLLCPGPSGPVTILTRRSDQLPQHAGQISFPGGRVHTDDGSPEATALRETTEETGLDPSGLILLGRLPVTVVPSTGFEITPVVAWTQTRPMFQPDPREVAQLIDCPLHIALDPASYKTGTMTRDGGVREFWFVDFDGHHVWGATARILRSLALLMRDSGSQPDLR